MSLVMTVNGASYEGWEEVSVQRSIETMTGSFGLGMSECGGTWPVHEGDPCEVRIGDEVVISGYIDAKEESYEADSHTISVSGRSKPADLVDCSVSAKPGQWKNRKFEDIARDLCKPHGITVTVEASTGAAIQEFAVQPGETVHEALTRAAKGRKLLLMGGAPGDLVITRAGAKSAGSTLVLGENLKKITVAKSLESRFSSYRVDGHPVVKEGYKSTDGSISSITATAKDPHVTRYRPMVIIAEERATAKYCRDRAEWEAKVRAGRGLTVTVTVAEWTKSDGKIWLPNTLVSVSAPQVGIEEELLITELEYGMGESGSETQMTLRRKTAYTDEVELPE